MSFPSTSGSSSASGYDNESTDFCDTVTESEEDGVGPSQSKKARVEKTLKPTGSGRFKKGWNLPKFITASAKGDKFAYCQLCSKDFMVSHSGFSGIRRHCDGLQHAAKYRESQKSTSITNLVSSSSLSSKVISAEVIMAQFIAMHNLPFQAADHLSSILSAMFPDSKIAAEFSSRHTKTKAIICDVIDPFLKNPLISVLKTGTQPYNILCDESNERGDTVKLLTILVRLFEESTCSIVTRHLDTVGIVDFTAEGIFTALKNCLESHNVPLTNLLSFTSDTCNVMKGVRGGVIAKLKSVQPSIIDINCICHLLSLCVKAAVKTLPLKIDEMLVDVFYHFHYSVNRIVSLQEYAEFCSTEFKVILKHCETRWLSLRQAICRTLQMWEPLVSYFTSHGDVEKPGKVKAISELLNNPSTKLWFLFLSNVIEVFDKFNKYFQSSSIATIHKLYGESQRLLKKVLSFFVKPSVIKENSNDLTKIKFNDLTNQVSNEDLFVGDSTAALILHLSENEGENVKVFYSGAVTFFETFVKTLLKKFDFKFEVLQMLSFLDPSKCQSIPLSHFDLIQDTMPITFDKNATKVEHREFVIDDVVEEIKVQLESDAVKFWLNVRDMKSPMGEFKYTNLSNLALQLLSIPASNADSERVFSLVRRIKTDYRSSLSTETLSSLIGCHFNKTWKCCERHKFEESAAKKCTHIRNMQYQQS